jgi:hypothetical protein
MSDFEEYIKNKYPEDYAVLSTMYSNQAMEELYPDQFEVWQHQQAIIDNLKAQLNNMEACYIEKKKRVEGLQARANKALSVTGNYCDEDDAALLVFVLEKALRGES